MLGYNVCAASSDEEAAHLRTSSLQSFVNLRRGQPGKLPPPVAGYEEQLSAAETSMIKELSRCAAVGSPDSVKSQIDSFLKQTDADELIIVSSVFDHSASLRSYEITAAILSLAA